ncbi:MAG TPA: hypothetical protein VJR29_00020 [bacterium]|nr:hypothetical protein [bacterium]
MRIALFAVGFLLLGSAALAQVPQDQELNYQGLKYACTGVGESKEDPRWANYSAKLMFTTGGRAYVSFIQVKIENAQGKLVLEADCDAPWVLAQLPEGSYTIKATADRKYPKSAKLQVGGGKQAELAIRFPEISGEM